MLLRASNGHPLMGKEEIQEAVFEQIDNIFRDYPWPMARYKQLPNGVMFTGEAIAYMGQPFLMEEIRRALVGLKGGTSTGPTYIPPELLKNIPLVVLESITEWANEVLQQGILPIQNECSNMIFLFKKGDPTKLDNYRTLATGCNMCKIVLKVVANRLKIASEMSNILGNTQMGFHAEKSCADNLFILDTVIQLMKSSNKKYMIALLDLCKAYDRVSRPLLWYELYKYGVPDKLGTLIKVAYVNAGSVIRFQNVITDRKNIELGLKQGCVMSPILFSLYLADLGRILESSGYGIQVQGSLIPGLFFADDIVIWEEERKFQSLLYVLAEYASNR